MYSAPETRLGNKQSLRVCVKRDLSSPHPEWGQLLSLPSASHEFSCTDWAVAIVTPAAHA